jgi:DNA-binding CsgD family transcriptional regulator
MAMSLNRRQVERWLKQGLSLRQIAARLDIPWTTFRRHWHQLQQEASPPGTG